MAHGLSCSIARGIFPEQGSNPRSLHWQADSQSVPQGSPQTLFLNHPKIMRPHNLRKVSGFLINYMVKFNSFFRYSSTWIIFDHYSNQENAN